MLNKKFKLSFLSNLKISQLAFIALQCMHKSVGKSKRKQQYNSFVRQQKQRTKPSCIFYASKNESKLEKFQRKKSLFDG